MVLLVSPIALSNDWVEVEACLTITHAPTQQIIVGDIVKIDGSNLAYLVSGGL